ncbi:MAG: hypothetical protein QME76_04310 [Bacillota bacterium]|nr:hypothetical protein [Bacillota bacterium]
MTEVATIVDIVRLNRWAGKVVKFRRYENHLELLDGQDVVDSIVLEYGCDKRIIGNTSMPNSGKHRRIRFRPSLKP